MAHYFESGFVVREKAWHGLAKVLDNAPATSAEAIRAAGLDWTVELAPCFADVHGEAHRASRYPRDGPHGVFP